MGEFPLIYDDHLIFTANESCSCGEFTQLTLGLLFLSQKKQTNNRTDKHVQSHPVILHKRTSIYISQTGHTRTVVAITLLSPTRKMLTHFCVKELILESNVSPTMHSYLEGGVGPRMFHRYRIPANTAKMLIT